MDGHARNAGHGDFRTADDDRGMAAFLEALPGMTNEELAVCLASATAILNTPVDLSISREHLLGIVSDATATIKAIRDLLLVRQGIAGWHAEASAAVH